MRQLDADLRSGNRRAKRRRARDRRDDTTDLFAGEVCQNGNCPPNQDHLGCACELAAFPTSTQLSGMDPAKNYGRAPDVKIGPLSLWVHGYEFSESMNYFDANLLRCTAHCGEAGARVVTTGSSLMTSNLHGWCTDLERMHATRAGTAHLEPIEQDLEVHLTATVLGHTEGTVLITPVPMRQSHSFGFQIDPSSLPKIVE